MPAVSGVHGAPQAQNVPGRSPTRYLEAPEVPQEGRERAKPLSDPAREALPRSARQDIGSCATPNIRVAGSGGKCDGPIFHYHYHKLEGKEKEEVEDPPPPSSPSPSYLW